MIGVITSLFYGILYTFIGLPVLLGLVIYWCETDSTTPGDNDTIVTHGTSRTHGNYTHVTGKCFRCDGTGSVHGDTCRKCGGTGRYEHRKWYR